MEMNDSSRLLNYYQRSSSITSSNKHYESMVNLSLPYDYLLDQIKADAELIDEFAKAKVKELSVHK